MRNLALVASLNLGAVSIAIPGGAEPLKLVCTTSFEGDTFDDGKYKRRKSDKKLLAEVVEKENSTVWVVVDGHSLGGTVSDTRISAKSGIVGDVSTIFNVNRYTGEFKFEFQVGLERWGYEGDCKPATRRF